MSIKDFILIILGIEPKIIAASKKINRIIKKKENGRKQQIVSADNKTSDLMRSTLNKIVASATWLLIILSVISLSGIIFIPLLRPDVEVPSILSQIVTITLGYFGGIISAFVRFNDPNDKDG